MKTSIIKISLILIGVLSLNTSWAQQPSEADRKAIKQAKKEMHQQARTYAKENVLPVVQTQRAKLDQQLSSTEQQELEEIRTELQEMKDAHRAKRKAFQQELQGERPEQRPAPSQEQIDAMRTHKKEMRLLMNRAWAIADAHEASIYQLLDEMEDDKQVWKEELGDMMKEHKADFQKEHEGERPIKPQQRAQREGGHHMGPGMHKGPHHGGLFGPIRKVISDPVAFLLWDGTIPERPERPERLGQEEKEGLTVFPNPSNASNQLRYTLEKNGLVTITLLNSEGVTLKTLSSKKQQKGDYTESFDLQGLEPGTYYYKVELPGERLVKRFVVK